MQSITFEQLETIVADQINSVIEDMQVTISRAIEAKKKLDYVSYVRNVASNKLFELDSFIFRLNLANILEDEEYDHIRKKIDNGQERLLKLDLDYYVFQKNLKARSDIHGHHD